MYIIICCLLFVHVTNAYCSWGYRFDAEDNHFNIVYPDMNATYFGMVLPSGATSFKLKGIGHPLATYFSLQLYNDDHVAYHFNDGDLLNNYNIASGYDVDIDLNADKDYIALFRIYGAQIDNNLNLWAGIPPITYVDNIVYPHCDIDYDQRGNIYTNATQSSCSTNEQFEFMPPPPHSLMNNDANYMIACIRNGVNYTVHIKLPRIMCYPDFDEEYDLRYASLSVVSTVAPRPTVSTIVLPCDADEFTTSIYVDENVPYPALLYRQILPDPQFNESIERAKQLCYDKHDYHCIQLAMGSYYPNIILV